MAGRRRSEEQLAEEARARRRAKGAERETPDDPGEGVDREVLPLAEERARIDTRRVETGRVRVSTRVETRREEFDVDLQRDDIEVQRVPVGRPVDGPVQVRQEGEVTIFPVLEEVLVVDKQLVLKEEVHVRRRSEQRREKEVVDLRYEEPSIERTAVDDASEESD